MKQSFESLASAIMSKANLIWIMLGVVPLLVVINPYYDMSVQLCRISFSYLLEIAETVIQIIPIKCSPFWASFAPLTTPHAPSIAQQYCLQQNSALILDYMTRTTFSYLHHLLELLRLHWSSEHAHRHDAWGRVQTWCLPAFSTATFPGSHSAVCRSHYYCSVPIASFHTTACSRVTLETCNFLLPAPWRSLSNVWKPDQESLTLSKKANTTNSLAATTHFKLLPSVCGDVPI